MAMNSFWRWAARSARHGSRLILAISRSSSAPARRRSSARAHPGPGHGPGRARPGSCAPAGWPPWSPRPAAPPPFPAPRGSTRSRFLERLQHLDLVALGQAALALGQSGLRVAEAVAAHHLVGQLLAAEHLLAAVKAASLAQDVEGGHGRADVHQRDDAVARRVQ